MINLPTAPMFCTVVSNIYCKDLSSIIRQMRYELISTWMDRYSEIFQITAYTLSQSPGQFSISHKIFHGQNFIHHIIARHSNKCLNFNAPDHVIFPQSIMPLMCHGMVVPYRDTAIIMTHGVLLLQRKKYKNEHQSRISIVC